MNPHRMFQLPKFQMIPFSSRTHHPTPLNPTPSIIPIPPSFQRLIIHQSSAQSSLQQMASESEPSHTPEGSPLLQLLINNSRNVPQLPLFLPFLIGFANNSSNSNSVQDSSEQSQENQETLTDRVILINPLTQSMVVLQSSSATNLEALFSDLFVSKDGQPPASKASVEAIPSVEITEENSEGECVICLENWEVGHVAKEMPCKHRFHGGCIEKWLSIHGSCPVCRFNMPVEEVQDFHKNNEIRVSFSIASGTTQNSDDNQGSSDDEPSHS